MSTLWVNDELNELLKKNWFGKKTNVYFVLSYPFSDIGKGHISAHLLNLLPRSGIVKFDGHLRRSSPGLKMPDDFETYSKYNPNKKFGPDNQLRGGDVLYEFLTEYGHRHSTTLTPDVVKFFANKLCNTYRAIGKPENLIVEIGGTVHSPENKMYALKAIELMKNKMTNKCKIVLLTTLAFRQFPSAQLKTRVLQDACTELKHSGLIPDMLFAREPLDMPRFSQADRKEMEAYIAHQIGDYRMIFPGYEAGRVTMVPHFSSQRIGQLSIYIRAGLKKTARGQ